MPSSEPMNFAEIAELEKQVLIPTYERLPILAVRGEGCYLYDNRGRRYRRPFEPLLPGSRFVRLNDVAHLRESFTPGVAALLIEVIQGEGGVVEISADFLNCAQELCRAHDALLMCDEIQCGLGRTGRF